MGSFPRGEEVPPGDHPKKGPRLVFETTLRSYELYLANLRWGGDYTWKVSALDGKGSSLCAAGLWTFAMPENKQKEKPGKEGGEGEPSSTDGANTSDNSDWSDWSEQ